MRRYSKAGLVQSFVSCITYDSQLRSPWKEGVVSRRSPYRIELSPLDPQRYYFESLSATAELSARQYENAERLARSSLLLNRMHLSTWRVLTISLVLQGRMDEARDALNKVRQLDPELTVTKYIARMPNGQLEAGQEWARCLAMAGLPTGNGNSHRH